jgi:shikimate dehydrogenase
LVALGAHRLHVSGRRAGAGEALARRLEIGALEVPWGEGVAGAVVVNATPMGMAGEMLPDAVVSGASGLFDMTYGAGTTPAVTRCRSRGLPVAEGVDMLLFQAAASFRLWTGRSADTTAMVAALGLPGERPSPESAGL